MLRKAITGAIVLNFVFMLLSVISTTDHSVVAQPTTIDGTAYATVPQILELVSGGIRQIDVNQSLGDNPWLYPNATNGFDFGELVYNATAGYMTGANFYTTLMVPVTSGRPYRVTITGEALTGPVGTIPNNAFLNIPDYQYNDVLGNATQAAMPADAFCGSVSSAVGTHTVYEDGGTTGESKIIRAIVAISGPLAGETYPVNYSRGHDGSTGVGTKNQFTSWTPVTANTPSGDYQGSVTYTLNLI
jgi:hypothetical protein